MFASIAAPAHSTAAAGEGSTAPPGSPPPPAATTPYRSPGEQATRGRGQSALSRACWRHVRARQPALTRTAKVCRCAHSTHYALSHGPRHSPAYL